MREIEIHGEKAIGKRTGSSAVVVAQLAERSLPTPKICGSNPDIGNEIF